MVAQSSQEPVADNRPSKNEGVVRTVMRAVRVQDSELKRWKRTFDSNAKVVVDGEKCVTFRSVSRFYLCSHTKVLERRAIRQCCRAI